MAKPGSKLQSLINGGSIISTGENSMQKTHTIGGFHRVPNGTNIHQKMGLGYLKFSDLWFALKKIFRHTPGEGGGETLRTVIFRDIP